MVYSSGIQSKPFSLTGIVSLDGPVSFEGSGCPVGPDALDGLVDVQSASNCFHMAVSKVARDLCSAVALVLVAGGRLGLTNDGGATWGWRRPLTVRVQ